MTLYLILTPNRERLLIWAVFLILAAILMFRAFIWMQYHLVEYPTLNTTTMVNGEIARPYAYRVLIPKLTVAVYSILPDTTHETLADVARSIIATYSEWTGNVKAAKINGRDDTFLSLRMLSGGWMLAFLAGYGMVLYMLGKTLFSLSPAACFFAPLIGYAILPIGLWRAMFMYDPAVLFFVALCFYLLLVNRWRSYIAIFLLACLNKETALYILFLYAICGYGRPNYKAMLLLQGVIWVSVTAVTHVYYAGNSGGAMEFHLIGNIQEWTFLLIPSQLIAMLSGIFMLVYRWQDKPLPLRQAMPVVLFAIAVWVGFGRLQEIRGLYDIFPILTLLLTHTLVVATGIDRGRIFKNA